MVRKWSTVPISLSYTTPRRSQVVASSSGTLHAQPIARTTLREFHRRHGAAVAAAAHAGMRSVPQVETEHPRRRERTHTTSS
jgi:hypothetical protein